MEVDGQPVWDMDEATEALMDAPLQFTVTVMSLEPEDEATMIDQDPNDPLPLDPLPIYDERGNNINPASPTGTRSRSPSPPIDIWHINGANFAEHSGQGQCPCPCQCPCP